MSTGKNAGAIDSAEIRTRIEILGREIDEYHRELNLLSIWLFLAIVGCWGIPQKLFQLGAFLISICFCVWQLIQGSRNRKSFHSQFKDIQEELLNPHLSDDERDANRHRLTQVTSKLELIRLKRTWPWVVSCIFLGSSLCYVLLSFR
jgi:hypothetical protein